MKKLLSLTLALLILLGLAGCKKEEVPSTQPSDTTAATTAPTTAPTEAVEAPQLYWVFADGGLRVRSGPGTTYEMVGGLEDGDVVEPTKWENGWAYIEEPVAGWCSGDYLHKLGWYKDVKTPEGTPPADGSLKGKWVHFTTPTEAENRTVSRAGIFRIRSNGTFIHMVTSFGTTEDGSWEAIPETTDPYWVGEYAFDGKVLTLRYMARLESKYDASGKIESREWVEYIHTVELPLDIAADGASFYSDFAYKIPVTVDCDLDMNTETTLYKASSKIGSPADICAILEDQTK